MAQLPRSHLQFRVQNALTLPLTDLYKRRTTPRLRSFFLQPISYSAFNPLHPQHKRHPRNRPHTRKMSTTPTPQIDPAYATLFQTLETRFATTSIPPSKWAILAIATIAAGPDPERADQLYLYLTSQPAYSTPATRKALTKRLREALFKSVIIVGVCKPIEAILAIAQVEREEDRDTTSPATREGWACDEDNHERGVGWFNKLYASNGASTLDLFAGHKDFAWLSTEITYGLFLSDRQVLDDLDTQMVVLPGILSQNLPKESHWHIRGTRRLGVAKGDVEVVCECVRLVAAFYGRVLDKVPSVEEVEGDV
ncbi:hypothetical protein BJX99DRAFT_234732 [Aspergillus californicus]